MNINWHDPASRAAAIDALGVEEYNRLAKKAHENSIIETVNGHAIYPVHTRFGRVFAVDGTPNAFYTIEDARACAKAAP